MQDNKALAVRGLLAGAIAALIACTLYFFQVFEGLEYQLYDWNFRTGQQQDAPAEIVIVAVDQPSLKRLGAWPWPRAYHAEVVRQVHRSGAKAIGVDFGFFEPARRDPMNDEELAAATAEAGNVIYPVVMEEITVKGAKQMIRADPVLCQNSDSHDIPKRRPTALGDVANTDTKLLICSLFQRSRVLAQDGSRELQA